MRSPRPALTDISVNISTMPHLNGPAGDGKKSLKRCVHEVGDLEYPSNPIRACAHSVEDLRDRYGKDQREDPGLVEEVSSQLVPSCQSYNCITD